MAQSANLSSGTACIMVKDPLLNCTNPDFVRWLRLKGFRSAYGLGHYENVDWVYVNINSMTYSFGKPGVKMVSVLGEQAVSIEEFMQIYAIFQKPSQEAPV